MIRILKRMKHNLSLESLTILDASLALVIGKRLISIQSFMMEKW
jgi:hypothetical protein